MDNKTVFRWLFFLIWGLVLLGLVMMSSVSVFESYQLMLKIEGADYCQQNNCNGFYLWRHFHHTLLGIPVFFLGFFAPIILWKRLALPIFLFSLFLLIALFVTDLGGNWGTARSWVNIPFLPSIQPSEMMKIAMIFYLAVWMDRKEKAIQTWENGFLPFVILMLPPVILLALQPDFGSLLVIAAIAAVMFFMAGGNLVHILLGGVLAGFFMFLPVIFSDCDVAEGERADRFCYIEERIVGFLSESDDANENYQVKQSLITIGSGKVFGLGVGGSLQRYGWLPEIQSDTIFAAAAEELGFFRIIFLVGAYALISFFGYQVAKNARSRFEMLVASGVTAWITFQAFINMAVVTKLFPVTGITLPFVSYGGSSLLTLLFASGILLHISQYSSYADNTSRRRIRRTHHSGARRRA
jgi:cell division protein FtsW